LRGESNVLKTILAARAARDALVASRVPGGGYRLPDWPAVRPRRTGGANATRAVVRLRTVQRLRVGFLDPIEDALYLTVGLRRLGFAATFHLGRELAPAIAPGGFHAWVECDGAVLSTSLPVHDEYVPILGSEEPSCIATSTSATASSPSAAPHPTSAPVNRPSAPPPPRSSSPA
jgi:hypothetical protein